MTYLLQQHSIRHYLNMAVWRGDSTHDVVVKTGIYLRYPLIKDNADVNKNVRDMLTAAAQNYYHSLRPSSPEQYSVEISRSTTPPPSTPTDSISTSHPRKR
jgi:hypothetical protein